MPWDIWLIFFTLGVILPWRGRVRMKKLLARPTVSTMERLVLYASTIAFQWLSVAVVAWRAWAHGYTASQFGLTIQEPTKVIAASIVGAVTIAALQWLNLRRVGRLPIESRGTLQPIAERILPQSHARDHRRSLRGVSLPGIRHGCPRERGIADLGRGRAFLGSFRARAQLPGTRRSRHDNGGRPRPRNKPDCIWQPGACCFLA